MDTISQTKTPPAGPGAPPGHDAQAAAGPSGTAAGGLRFLKLHMREYGMLLSLVAIVLFFQYMTDGTLLQPVNVTNVVLQNSYIVIMALGMLLVIVAGYIDLSVGSVSGFIGAMAAVMMVGHDWGFVPTVLVCLAAGALIGAAQGWFVAWFRIPSFIVTLAGMLVFRGLSLWLLQGQSVGPFTSEFQHIASGFIPDFFPGHGFHVTTVVIGLLVALALVAGAWRGRSRQREHGMELEPPLVFAARIVVLAASVVALAGVMATYKGLPNVLLVMFALMLAYDFIAKRTVLGRRIYALGGNEKAARLSGIRTERLAFLTFVNMGLLSAVAGLVFAARLNTATPKAGLGFELDVIAACFIGGASASGGVGKVVGAVVGAFVMGVMNNGMSIIGVGIDWQQVIKGLVLLAAVCVDVYNKRK